METERKLKIGVVGGAGYTAGELLRIIMGHPKVKVDFVYSTSSARETPPQHTLRPSWRHRHVLFRGNKSYG